MDDAEHDGKRHDSEGHDGKGQDSRGHDSRATSEHDDVVCRIVRGELDAAVVLRTDEVVAFLDHHPVFKGHTLVAPVRHVDTLLELPDDLMVPVLAVAQRVARAQSAALGAQGTFVAVNNVVSQSVPHLHVHVVPRTKGDGLRGFFWPRTRYADGEQEAYATLLREALELPSTA